MARDTFTVAAINSAGTGAERPIEWSDTDGQLRPDDDTQGARPDPLRSSTKVIVDISSGRSARERSGSGVAGTANITYNGRPFCRHRWSMEQAVAPAHLR